MVVLGQRDRKYSDNLIGIGLFLGFRLNGSWSIVIVFPRGAPGGNSC